MPVLAFPDMRCDQEIDTLARASHVQVMWGLGRFATRLVGLAESCVEHSRPTVADIEAEIRAITTKHPCSD